MAHATIVAGGTAFVHLRKNGAAADGHHTAVVEMLRNRFLHNALRAIHFHRRKKFPVRELREAFGLATYAGEFFDVVVPRRDVLIANRPIYGDTVAQVGFEIQIAPAITLAAPDDGFAANLAAANPCERLSGIGGERIFEIVDEELAGILVAGIVTLALDRLDAPAFFTPVPAAKF